MKNPNPSNMWVETDKLIDLEQVDAIGNKTSDNKLTEENTTINNNIELRNKENEKPKRKYDLVWFNIIGFAFLHLMALYGLYLCFSAKFVTIIWAGFVTALCQLGVTIGAHRLYTHRTFEAKAPLRLFFLACHTIAGQNCMYIWVRDHRQHHKHSDTDADPHNAKNGFFFSHIGWLMCRKHPDVIAKGKLIDMSDLQADPHVMFQAKYYKPLYTLFAVVLPVFIPYFAWHETLAHSFFIAYSLRYMAVVNITWLVNSAAHLYGTRPYDKNIQPVEQPIVSFLTLGEGWHNFHHAFPWDYRAAEYGVGFNNNAFVIEMCEKLGWASNLRSISKTMLMKKVRKSGDGSHTLWGYGDKDMKRHLFGVVTSTSPVEQRYIDMMYQKNKCNTNAEVLVNNRNRKETAMFG